MVEIALDQSLDRLSANTKIFFSAQLASSETSSSLKVVSYSWDFGDPKIPNLKGAGPIPITYTTSGTKTVILTAIVEDIASTTGEQTIIEELDIELFEFSDEITGPDRVSIDKDFKLSVGSGAEDYVWTLDSEKLDQFDGLNEIELSIDSTSQKIFGVTIINGKNSKSLNKRVTPVLSGQVSSDRVETELVKDLLFFNKEGDLLNFDFQDFWSGDLIFHPNSTEIFKTQALYVFERVPSINLQDGGLNEVKFQLFNERGIDFVRGLGSIAIDKVEPSVVQPKSYSKWVYAQGIQDFISVGHQVYFDVENSETEDFSMFQDNSTSGQIIKTYTCIEIELGRALFITETDNKTWNDSSIEISGSMFSGNTIRVWEPDKVSYWNQIDVTNINSISGLYKDKRLNVIGSNLNDGIYTVKDPLDRNTLGKLQELYNPFNLLKYEQMPPASGLRMELDFLNSIPDLGSQNWNLIQASTNPGLSLPNLLYSNQIPGLLKPGIKFTFDENSHGLNDEYVVLRRGLAIDVLKADLDDSKKFEIETKKVYEFFNSTPNIRLFNTNLRTDSIEVFQVNLDISPRYEQALNIIEDLIAQEKTQSEIKTQIESQYTLNDISSILYEVFSNQVNGINIERNGAVIELRQADGWSLNTIQLKRDDESSLELVVHDELISNLPTEAIISNTNTSLDASTLGFVFHRKSENKFFIQKGFDGSPIWTEISENDVLLSIDALTWKNLENFFSSTYLTQNKISFSQEWENTNLLTLINNAIENLEDVEQESHPLFRDILLEKQKILNRFVISNRTNLNTFDVDLNISENGLESWYFWPLGSKDQSRLPVSISFFPLLASELVDGGNTAGDKLEADFVWRNVFQFQVKENLSQETSRRLGTFKNNVSKLWQRTVLLDDIDSEGFTIYIDDVPYPVNADDLQTGLSLELDEKIDSSETLKDWGSQRITKDLRDGRYTGLKYHEELSAQGLKVWLEASPRNQGIDTSAGGHKYGAKPYDMIKFESFYPNIDFNVRIEGTLNTARFLNKQITFFTETTRLEISILGNVYRSTGINTDLTIENWLSDWSISLSNQGIFVERWDFNEFSDPGIMFSTLEQSDELEITIKTDRSASPGEIITKIDSFVQQEQGIVISGNEIVALNDTDFQSLGFSTGMLTSVSGSKFNPNNRVYNITSVDPKRLGLSYQGPFWATDQQLSEGYENLALGPEQPTSTWDWDDVDDEPNIIDFEYSPRILNGNDAVQLELIGVGIATNADSLTWNVEQEVIELQNNDVVYRTFAAGSIEVSLTIEINGQTFSQYIVIQVTPEDPIQARVSEIPESSLSVITDDFIRYPRFGWDEDNNTSITVRWEQTNPEIFLYDLSGDMLTDIGELTYVGPKPLFADDQKVVLNRENNRDVNKVNIPESQKTVFESLNYELPLNDDPSDLSFAPEPLQIFVGYSQQQEGTSSRTLLIEQDLSIEMKVITSKINPNQVGDNLDFDRYKDVVSFIPELGEIRVGKLEAGGSSSFDFVAMGFKPGHKIVIESETESTNVDAILSNSGTEFTISQVRTNSIIVQEKDKLKSEISIKKSDSTIPPYRERNVLFNVIFKVLPKQLARIDFRGQSEAEDDRYRINLKNFGINLDPKDSFIFKEYDINEKGLDWMFINAKRKELLNNFNQIYWFIGSYKALINAINFFGYNDLILNEYFRNIDRASKRFGKLQKVEVSDIFNNNVSGFEINDFLLGKFPNVRYKKTNLFNLTYKITDEFGNSVLSYDLDEVVQKLIGLKGWLQSEVMPIGKRIFDLTGQTETAESPRIAADGTSVTSFKFRENLQPIDFDVVATKLPVSSQEGTWKIDVRFKENDLEQGYFSVKASTYEPEGQELKPTQTLNSFRTDVSAWSFAVNANIDPNIKIETINDNGYGLTYKVKKTFRLTGNGLVNS